MYKFLYKFSHQDLVSRKKYNYYSFAILLSSHLSVVSRASRIFLYFVFFFSRPPETGKIRLARETNLSGFYFPCDFQNSIVALNVKWGVKLWAPQRDFVFQGSLSASLLG